MQKLVTLEQIRNIESDLIEKSSADISLKLMEKAGFGLAEVLQKYNEPYLFICGKGNNGGDGLVAARYLYDLGKKVQICLISEEALLSPDSKTNLDLIKGKISYISVNEVNSKLFCEELNKANTVIECLVGTGTNKKSNSLFEWIIKTVNDSSKTVVACDIPIGVNPDTGSIQEYTIKATATVTFGYPKIGLVLYPAKEYVGMLKVIDIGLPDANTDSFLLDDLFLKENLPNRKADSNKGSFGKTLLVCGNIKYPGAALLTGKAASSIGSGLTAMASPKEVFNQITKDIPEITHVEFNEAKILEESKNSSVMVIGPGLTNTDETKTLVERLITKINIPIVLDADGINVLAGNKEIIKSVKSEIVLTPHPKEFARLTETSVEKVLNNKIDLVKEVANNLGCTIVLKGPGTIVCNKDKKIFISPFANSALAKGGTGDVLAGFIGGLIAQGLKPDLAACVAVYIHGKSGELVAKDKTVFSLLPQDLITYLPQVIKMYL